MAGPELYNSRIINGYIKLIRSKYNFVNVDELLHYANMERYQVEDQGHWFTQNQIDRFYEKCKELTGNEKIAREAGRYAISLDAMGAVGRYVLSLADPIEAYKLFAKLTKSFTRSATYKVEVLGPTKVRVTVTPAPGIEERPFQCENRLGYFEAVALSHCHQMPQIEHDECLFEGGSTCRYEISWKDTRPAKWKKIRKSLIVVAMLLCLALLLASHFVGFFVAMAVSIVILQTLDIYSGMIEREELSLALSHLRSSGDELIQRIDAYSNNIGLVSEIGLVLSKQLEVENIFRDVVDLLSKRLDYDRGLILLSNREKTLLQFRAGFGYDEAQLKYIEETCFNINRPDSKGPFVVAYQEHKPILVNDVEEIVATLSPKSLEFVQKMGTKSFICCPIVYENESLGILAVDNKHTKRPFLQSDISLLMGIAPEIGISIHNAELIRHREEQFKSTLEVLAKSIDARDFLTAGHSEKVTEYAVGISKELGLSDDYREMIRVASLLHDYGKIGISDAILKKPGKLTHEEYEEIKTHAEKTRQILLKINFQGIYREVPEIAGAHHEKVDGSGYPKGLNGDSIPLGAKIIAVADFFEAVTAKRHYRDPMPIEVALQMLEEKRDVHYDGVVIDAFLRYFEGNSVLPSEALQNH